jgi:hypothetical protein
LTRAGNSTSSFLKESSLHTIGGHWGNRAKTEKIILCR